MVMLEKKKIKTLMSHYRNVYHIKDILQRTKCPLRELENNFQ